jgi:hypothetical protein
MRTSFLVFALAVSGLASVACGGTAETNDGSSSGAIEPGKGCPDVGATQPAGDGCNSCTCTESGWACTDAACAQECVEGETGSSPDGCNTCACVDGTWACTERLCGTQCTDGEITNDGCNTCSCFEGSWACTENDCAPPQCTEGEVTDDGCNTCSCSGGQWLCTQAACPVEECPAPRPDDGGCIQQVVYARSPDTGACCEYGTPCQVPGNDWEVFNSAAECQGTTPVCTVGDTKPAGDGCNMCWCTQSGAAPAAWVCTLAICTSEPTGCGGWLGDTCTESEYCAYEEGQLCGAADASSTCQPRPELCTGDYKPVCGCDGQTYGNACSAASSGTGVYQSGECAQGG